MNMKHTMALIASGGNLGKFIGGNIVFSAIALPLCFLLSTVFAKKPLVVSAIVAVVLLASIIIAHFAVSGEGGMAPERIVLDSAVGVLVSFLFLPFWFKLTAFGFILFHLLSFLKRFVQLKGFAAKLTNLPGVLSVFVDNLIVGVLVNFFLRLMMWIFI